METVTFRDCVLTSHPPSFSERDERDRGGGVEVLGILSGWSKVEGLLLELNFQVFVLGEGDREVVSPSSPKDD